MLDLPLAIGGLLVGVIVGLTGMGGGALMTPMLVFFFHADPLTAISSDLVASFVMKPAGALVHLRRKTVNLGLVRLLCLGSVPAAFAGAWFISLQPRGEDLDNTLKVLLGSALLVAAGGLVARALFQMWQNALPLGEGAVRPSRPEVVLKPLPTILLGAAAGFVVGITSVGSGSIVIVVLLLIYPGLKASALVGTDLTQAIPLVGAAALGHLLFGELLVRDHRVAARRRDPGRIHRRADLEPGTGRDHPSGAGRAPARLGPAPAGPEHRSRAGRRGRLPRAWQPRLDRDSADCAGSAAVGVTNPIGAGPDGLGAGESGRGAVVFLTGLSGAGKSTIAGALAAALEAEGRPITMLDGDELRRHLTADLGFDAASREANVRKAAELAAAYAGEGRIVIAALIAPFERSRAEAREIVERAAPFLLVYVRTPLAVAESRDPKGLYKRARAGEIRDFTGIDSPYEEPTDADLVVDTTATTVLEAVALIRERLGEVLGEAGDRG